MKRKQQLQKVLKHYTKGYLAHVVYNLGYNFDYESELLEYSPSEHFLDYAINHAHDVATTNNDIDELESQSKEYLYNSMVDLFKAMKEV